MDIINFGVVKSNVINKASSNLIKEDKEDKTFIEFSDIVKNSPILTKEFYVYKNLESKNIKDDFLASKYIDENISLFKDVKYTELITENYKLNKFLSGDEVDSHIKNLYEAIHNIIVENTIKKGIKSVDKIHESFEFILNHIKNNDTEIIEESESVVDDEFSEYFIENIVNRFNTTYSDLNENEVKIFNSLLTEEVSAREEIFNKILNETKNKISVLIREIDQNFEDHEKLNKTLKKLEEMKFNDSVFEEEIFKINDLNNSL